MNSVGDLLLNNPHHLGIVIRFFQAHPEIEAPSRIFQYDSWAEVPNKPSLGKNTLVFVDGGIRDEDLDLGGAILINDGGIINAEIKCGWFYKAGGIVSGHIKERGRTWRTKRQGSR